MMMRFRVFHFTIHRKKLFLFPVLTAICSAILLMNLSISSSRADSIEDILTDASDWLLNQQQENGSFGTVNETREIDTTEAFKTLFYLEKDTAALIKVITRFDDQDQADSDNRKRFTPHPHRRTSRRKQFLHSEYAHYGNFMLRSFQTPRE